MQKAAILLVNIGTPDKPTKKAVGIFLSQFLNDKYVIDIPAIWRFLLVHCIIVPFRTAKSTVLYKSIWTNNGSPLLHITTLLATKLESKRNSEIVFAAMRYGNPNIASILKRLQHENVSEITVVPLYPQYASSTTLTTIAYTNYILKKLNYNPTIRFVPQFYNHAAFIEAFTTRIKQYETNNYDHIVFSFHGLPIRHIHKIHSFLPENECACTTHMPTHGHMCYKATCYETARILAKQLQLAPEKFTVSFQSRIGKNWIAPFTDNVLVKLAQTGTKQVLVIAPSFVTDCLETLYEINIEYKKLFIEHGGTKLTLVESLNDADFWVDALNEFISPK